MVPHLLDSPGLGESREGQRPFRPCEWLEDARAWTAARREVGEPGQLRAELHGPPARGEGLRPVIVPGVAVHYPRAHEIVQVLEGRRECRTDLVCFRLHVCTEENLRDDGEGEAHPVAVHVDGHAVLPAPRRARGVLDHRLRVLRDGPVVERELNEPTLAPVERSLARRQAPPRRASALRSPFPLMKASFFVVRISRMDSGRLTT